MVLFDVVIAQEIVTQHIKIESSKGTNLISVVDTYALGTSEPLVSLTSAYNAESILDIVATDGETYALEVTAGGTSLAVGIINNSDEAAITIDNNSIAQAITIDMDCNDASDRYAIKIMADNAGAGKPGGIDLSTFSSDEPLLKVPADAISSAGSISHQIPVNIGGTVFYLVAYTHGS